MGNWTLENKAKISSMLGVVSWLAIGVDAITGKATAFPTRKLDDVELILGYDSFKGLYFAWNPYVHDWHTGKEITMKCGITAFALRKKNFEAILPIYRKMNGGPKVEKLVVIKERYIADFCCHFKAYLEPNSNDEGFKQDVIYADKTDMVAKSWSELKWPASYVQREYRTCSKLERDSRFRSQCLQAYGSQCVVCGCNTKEILEAAHIIAVKDGGKDEVNNSVCLCANHHRLYDAKLLRLNWSKGTFTCLSETEESMPWYIAAQKNNFKLLHERAQQK